MGVCCCLVAKSCPTLLWPRRLYARLRHLWHFPGGNTGLCCHFLLQGIFLTQGLNSCLLYWQTDSLQWSHLGSPTGVRGPDRMATRNSIVLTSLPQPLAPSMEPATVLVWILGFQEHCTEKTPPDWPRWGWERRSWAQKHPFLPLQQNALRCAIVSSKLPLERTG